LDANHIASGSADTTIKIWDINSGQCVQTLEGGDTDGVSCICKLDDNRIASSNFATIKIWNINPLDQLTVKQLVFIIALEHQHSQSDQPVPIAEWEDEDNVWNELPEKLQKRMIELGWVIEPLTRRIRNTIHAHPTAATLTLGAIGTGAFFAGRYLWKRWRKN